MAEEDLIFCRGEPALNKGEHGSETVSAAANVTALSLDECDFWQMKAVTPSAVQQVMRPATGISEAQAFIFQGCKCTDNAGAGRYVSEIYFLSKHHNRRLQ